MSQQLADFLASNWFVFLFAWGVLSICESGVVFTRKLGIAPASTEDPKEASRFEHCVAVVFGVTSDAFGAALLFSLAVIFFRWKGWA